MDDELSLVFLLVFWLTMYSRKLTLCNSGRKPENKADKENQIVNYNFTDFTVEFQIKIST